MCTASRAYKLYEPFCNNPALVLKECLESKWSCFGLNQLTRYIELEYDVLLKFDCKDFLAPDQSTIVDDRDNKNVYWIWVSSTLDLANNKGDQLFVRYRIAHELAHLIYGHQREDAHFVQSDEYPDRIIRPITGSDGTTHTYTQNFKSQDEIRKGWELDSSRFSATVLARYNYLFERHELDDETILNIAEEIDPVAIISDLKETLDQVSLDWPLQASDERLTDTLIDVCSNDKYQFIQKHLGEDGIRDIAKAICNHYRDPH